MSDATSMIMVRKEPAQREQIGLILTSGQKVFQGALAAIALGTGKAVNGTGGNQNLLVIGRFYRDYDASATGANADMPCLVKLTRPISGTWLANSASTPVTQAYVGQVVYVQDNQTATITASANAVAGICWEVSSLNGVLVETLPVSAVAAAAPSAPIQVVRTSTTTWVPTAAALVHGATYLVNATTNFTGAATVTLPAVGVAAGTEIAIVLAAVGQTVTISDATGPTALTGALSATVRQMCYARNVGTAAAAVWVVNSYANAS